MAQLISCPECTRHLQVPDNLLGQTVQCPECGHMFTAAAPPAEKPAEEPKFETAAQRKQDSRADDDDRPSKREVSIRRDGAIPSKVTNLGVMALIGGIFAVLLAVGGGISLAALTCGVGCLWPGTYYSLVIGILAIIKGAALMGSDAHTQTPPVGIAVLLIINIINVDVVGLTLGIIMLVFCGDEDVKQYLAKQ